MEITNSLLNELGADPKVYRAEERALIGDFADKILEGDLSSLLESCALPSEKVKAYSESFKKNCDDLLTDMREVARLAEELATLYASKTTIFISSLTEKELEKLLFASLRITNAIHATREHMLDTVNYIYGKLEPLLDIQYTYNNTLARLGMIHLAAMAAEKEGCEYNEEEVMPMVMEAYEQLTELTELINDLKDKAVIYENSAEHEMGRTLNEVADFMDLDHDGKSLKVSGIMGCAAKFKRIAESVLQTYV